GVESEEQRLRNERISHEQFEKQLQSKFMTLWDDNKSEWVFNKQEYLDFFEMKERLQSERAVYAPALEAVNKEYGPQLEKAKARLDASTHGTKEFTAAKKEYGKIARKMDMAWISYANDVEQFAPELNKKVSQKLETHQERLVKVMDKGKER